MDRYQYAKSPRWWSPLPSRFFRKLWKPLRRRHQLRGHRILDIQVKGLEHVAASIKDGHGVLVTPNHAGHGDCYLLLEALSRLRRDFYIMTAWQVFQLARPFVRLAYRHHGCFSIDRETSDLTAYREAVRILTESSSPLVVFPEGDVYHLAERVMPLHDGTFTMATTAARRSGRPVACVPCALEYEYTSDPTPELLPVIAAIERQLGTAPGDGLSLSDRAEQLIEATIAWRASQYGVEPGNGCLENRLAAVQEAVVARGEWILDLEPGERNVIQRVKQLRQTIIQNQAGDTDGAADIDSATYDSIMEDAFVAVQLYSYQPGYVAAQPTIERIAETVDKLEEDVLGLPTARIRGQRRGVIRFGSPTLVEASSDRATAQALGQDMRERIQELISQPTADERIRPIRAGEYSA